MLGQGIRHFHFFIFFPFFSSIANYGYSRLNPRPIFTSDGKSGSAHYATLVTGKTLSETCGFVPYLFLSLMRFTLHLIDLWSISLYLSGYLFNVTFRTKEENVLQGLSQNHSTDSDEYKDLDLR